MKSDPDAMEVKRVVSGRGEYVGDHIRSNDLWARVVRSPVAHGRLLGVETEEATRMEGVHAVLDATNLGEVPCIPIRIAPRPAMEEARQPIIAIDTVRYVGEPLALVIAEDPYLAEDAAALVQPRISACRAQLEFGDPRELGRRPLSEERLRTGHLPTGPTVSGITIEARMRIPRQTAVPLEPRGVIAEWINDGRDLHVWGPTKFLHFTRDALSAFFGLGGEHITCHRVDVGGMFGVRGELYPEDFLIPWAARTLGRRVAWVEDRLEHFQAINHSRQQRHDVALTITDEGRLEGLQTEAVLDVGAYARPIGARMLINILESMPGPYEWRWIDGVSRGMTTNKTPVGTMRAPGTFEGTFVRERAIDIAAAQARQCPAELRLRNLLAPHVLPHTIKGSGSASGIVYDSGDFPAVFRAMLARTDYFELRRRCEKHRAEGQLEGVGLGCFMFHSGIGKAESVELELLDTGRFRLGTSATEFGQGLPQMLRGVAANTLGIARSAIEVDHSSTNAHPGGAGTFASRSAVFAGSATFDACLRIREAACNRAANSLGVNPTELEIESAGLRHGSDLVSWKELAPLTVVGKHRMEHPTYGFGVHVAHVTINPSTAELQVKRLAVGYDCGRILEPAAATEQIRGAAVQGLGNTLLEELRYDAEGKLITAKLTDYLLPTAMEVPQVEVHLFESAPAPGNPLGVKGVGEAGTVGVAAAIANAAADALGPRGSELTDLPLSPERIYPLLPSPTATSSFKRR